MARLIIALALFCWMRNSAEALTAGATYDPFHHELYPIVHGDGGDAKHMTTILKEDFNIIRRHFSLVSTFYSSHFGVPVAPLIHNAGLQCYLGVYMTSEPWGEEQISAAINAGKHYPGTVKAIIVGSENVKIRDFGTYSADDIIKIIRRIKTAVPGVPVGTSQRINEWLVKDGEVDKLAAECDIIGTTIYPFFSKGWDPSNPMALLDAQWKQMLERFPSYHSKIRLTETGWPTDGGHPRDLRDNVANYANAAAHFKGFSAWEPSIGEGEKFYFTFFDRRSDEPVLKGHPAFERFFGLVDNNRKWKFGGSTEVPTTISVTTAEPPSTVAPTLPDTQSDKPSSTPANPVASNPPVVRASEAPTVGHPPVKPTVSDLPRVPTLPPSERSGCPSRPVPGTIRFRVHNTRSEAINVVEFRDYLWLSCSRVDPKSEKSIRVEPNVRNKFYFHDSSVGCSSKSSRIQGLFFAFSVTDHYWANVGLDGNTKLSSVNIRGRYCSLESCDTKLVVYNPTDVVDVEVN